MSLTLNAKLDSLLNDENLTESEKQKIFEELLLRLLEKNKYEDFKTIIKVYDFENKILEEIFEKAIQKDLLNFVIFMITNENIKISHNNIITAIKHEKTKILDYFLSLCDIELLTEDLIEITDNKIILKLLLKKGINSENKEKKILNNAKLMYEFGNMFDNITRRGDIYTLKFIHSYIDYYLAFKNSDKFLENINQLLETMITKKEFNHKNNILNNFYEFLKQSKDEEFLKNILSISK